MEELCLFFPRHAFENLLAPHFKDLGDSLELGSAGWRQGQEFAPLISSIAHEAYQFFAYQLLYGQAYLGFVKESRFGYISRHQGAVEAYLVECSGLNYLKADKRRVGA